jgi:hypothetical protein
MTGFIFQSIAESMKVNGIIAQIATQTPPITQFLRALRVISREKQITTMTKSMVINIIAMPV